MRPRIQNLVLPKQKQQQQWKERKEEREERKQERKNQWDSMPIILETISKF
jgi:hypothetical protein